MGVRKWGRGNRGLSSYQPDFVRAAWSGILILSSRSLHIALKSSLQYKNILHEITMYQQPEYINSNFFPIIRAPRIHFQQISFP